MGTKTDMHGPMCQRTALQRLSVKKGHGNIPWATLDLTQLPHLPMCDSKPAAHRGAGFTSWVSHLGCT